MFTTGMRGRLGFNFYDVFYYGFITIFAFICFYPLWYVFLVSIMDYKDYVRTTFIFLPIFKPTFEDYTFILTQKYFLRAFMVSVARTGLGTFGTIMFASAMAYAVSKVNIKGMKVLNFLMIFAMFFSGGLIPTFMLYKSLHLIGSFWAMVIPSFTAPGTFIIMRNYFSYSIPHELEDSSKIDGASELTLFFRIVLPLSKPMIAALSLFTAVSHWNDFMTYLIYVDKLKYQPFIWILQQILVDPNATLPTNSGGASVYMGPPISLKMTTIICAMLPIMIVYPYLQKYFAQGILIGAVKG
jgi:ABC-type sugar transport system, permease component